MTYTIKQLADIAGVSTRTLRYYDEINVLKPLNVNHAGYRSYGHNELNRLQHIRFLRELDLDLNTIVAIINDPSFDRKQALEQHYAHLLQKRHHIDRLLETLERTIRHEKGERPMKDHEKFTAFKEKTIADNEEKYGQEIRQKYGDDTIDTSNEIFRGMSQDTHTSMQALEKEVLNLLQQAYQTGDPSSDLAQKTVEKHKQWLMYAWSTYTKDAHAGLAEMYVADERFKTYYDSSVKGGAEFLRDAILIFTEKK